MNSRKTFLKNLGSVVAGIATAPSLDVFGAKKAWFDVLSNTKGKIYRK